MGSSTTFCTFRMEMPSSESPIDGWIVASVRFDSVRRISQPGAAIRGCRKSIALFEKRHPELLKHVAPADEQLHWVMADVACFRFVIRKNSNAFWDTCWMKKEFFGPYGIRLFLEVPSRSSF